MEFKIGVIRGDGIGPEIVDSTILVLNKIGEKFGHNFDYLEILAGGTAIDQTGQPLPEASLQKCLAVDSVLLGAVGGPKWDALPGHLRPEAGLMKIRAALEVFTNLRPAKLYSSLRAESPLRRDIAEKGFDLIFVRELTGGIYFGKRGRLQNEGGEAAYDTEIYSAFEVERIGRAAFDLARKRRRKLTSIDKANVLESSRLWRETMHKLAAEYPDVEYGDMLVDNAAMQLVRDPAQFDVVVAGNMFGDILSDEAAMITGSIGLLPSASLGESKRGLYEPIHGSAPALAGQNKANPLATILSAAMMLRYSFDLAAEAGCIENAVSGVLADGYSTADILGASTKRPLSTSEITQKVLERLER